MDNLYQEIFDNLPVASVCHKVITDGDDQVLKFDLTGTNKEFRRLYPNLFDSFQKNQSNSEKSDFFSILAKLWQKQNVGISTLFDSQRNLKFESKILNDSIIITTITTLRAEESVQPNKKEKSFEGNFLSHGSEGDFSIFSEALKHSPVSVMITDNEGTIEYVNDAFIEVSGYSADQVIGEKPGLLKSGLVPPDDYEQLWKTIKMGAVWRGEFINKRSNGELFFEKATIVPVFDPEGINTHFIALKEDITEKKKCYQELIDIRQKARESEVLKAAFLQNMSHEIRTPMNAILGFSELAKMSDTPDDKRNSYLQIVIESTHRLLGIVDDIMDISKMETDNVVLKKSPIRLPGFMMSLFKSFSDNTGSRVKMNKPMVEAEFENATVYLDSARLRQVMENLLSNAVKFTKEGNIYFGCLKSGDKIRFYVEDTGVGIAPDMQSLVFQPFYQTDSGATRAFGGNGLGLTIASRIIDKMGSRIMVDSTPGKGSVFYFDLWLRKDASSGSSEKKYIGGSSSNLDQYNLLIAGVDEMEYIFIREIILRDFGDNMRIFKAPTAVKAIKTCREHGNIDLILLDLNMRDNEGERVGRQLKSMNPNVVILGLADKTKQKENKKIAENGLNDVVSKPISREILVSCINKSLIISH
jgi:hypothetical protein